MLARGVGYPKWDEYVLAPGLLTVAPPPLSSTRGEDGMMNGSLCLPPSYSPGRVQTKAPRSGLLSMMTQMRVSQLSLTYSGGEFYDEQTAQTTR
jgi:hypothetical protein